MAHDKPFEMMAHDRHVLVIHGIQFEEGVVHNRQVEDALGKEGDGVPHGKRDVVAHGTLVGLVFHV